MFLREWLWLKFFSHGLGLAGMPARASMPELLIAILLGLLWIAVCYFALNRAFFLICEHAWDARMSAILFGFCLGASWILGALGLAGIHSIQWMIVVVLVSTLSVFGYLALARSK